MLPAVLDGGNLSQPRTGCRRWTSRIDLRMDALAMILTLVVAGIGALVMLYSARYFPADDEALGRYTGSLTAFAGAMLGVVWADNLILLVIFWELTGVLSLPADRAPDRQARVPDRGVAGAVRDHRRRPGDAGRRRDARRHRWHLHAVRDPRRPALRPGDHRRGSC